MTCDKIPAPQDVAGQQENEEGHCRCYHLNLMVVLSLYAVNAIIVEQQKNRQREISHTLLSYSEELTQNIASTLKNTTVQGCDSASLNVYRKLKMRSLYFADVGFIERGKSPAPRFGASWQIPSPFP